MPVYRRDKSLLPDEEHSRNLYRWLTPASPVRSVRIKLSEVAAGWRDDRVPMEHEETNLRAGNRFRAYRDRPGRLEPSQHRLGDKLFRSVFL